MPTTSSPRAKPRNVTTPRQIAEQLQAIRLDRGWSFRELGEQIGRALGKPAIPEPTIRLFVREDRGVLETTLYRFQKFIELVDEGEV